MRIYDKTKLIGRTFIESVNILFSMGKDLEARVEELEERVKALEDEINE